MSSETTTQDLTITRVFEAPIEAVWNAWTDSTAMKKWWGPTGFTCPLAEMDVRVGGQSLVAMSSPDFGTHYSLFEYRDIVPMQRIDYIHSLADPDGNKIDPTSVGMPEDFPRDQRQLVTFKDLGDGRTELTVAEFDWTVGQMMEMSRLGLEQSLDKLANSLKQQE